MRVSYFSGLILGLSFFLATLENGCGKSQNPPPTTAPTSATTTPGNPSNVAPLASVTVVIPQDAPSLGANAFGTNPLLISPGTTVVWSNQDTMTHTTTSRSNVWDSNNIPPGGTFSFQFNNPGLYPYYCKIHPNMSGSIQVVQSLGGVPGVVPSPSPNPSPSPTPAPSFTPIPPLNPVPSPPPSIGPIHPTFPGLTP